MITAVIDAGQHYCQAVSDLWQWDYGQTLRIQGVKLPAAVEVQFSTTERIGETVTRIGVTQEGVTEVPIPDTLLEGGGTTQDYTIYAFVYIENGDSGKTEYRVSMKVRARPKPEAHATPEEGELFRQAIVAVAESADRAESARKSAEASADEAKTSKENAETAVKNAEAFKTEAETARSGAVRAATESTDAKDSAEKSRAAAEKAKQDAEAAKAAADADKEAAEAAQAKAEAAQKAAENAETEAKKAHTATETAKNDAVQAKEAAEKAKSGTAADREVAEAASKAAQVSAISAEKSAERAETAKEEIQESADQIQKNATEIDSLKEDLENLTITNIKGIENIGGDYNEISKAKVVTSSEELLSSTENAILYDNNIAYGDIESSVGNAVLKLFVHEGDVIRQRISPYWSTATNGYYWIGSYDSNGKKVGNTIRITRDYGNTIKENGYTIPSGINYILINIKKLYYAISASGQNAVETNGLTADIITVNREKTLTEYDNKTGKASDYFISELYYKINDDLRIDRYERLLGEADNTLKSIVGGV